MYCAIASGPWQSSHSRVQVPQSSRPNFTVSLNLEGQVPIFVSHRSRVSQLYPQALGSLFVASYDSQGYGRGILTRLHTQHTHTHTHTHTQSTCNCTEFFLFAEFCELPLNFMISFLCLTHKSIFYWSRLDLICR
jgi:hypothetical protein